jgi:lipopolysaccharide export system protein LptC
MSATTVQGLEALQYPSHGSWEPRRALTLNTARRRTAFVRLLRFTFIAAAIGIVVLLIAQLILGGTSGPTETQEAVSTDIRMINPRFTGRDDNLTPYTVTADVATRSRDSQSGLTELERPRLDYDFLNAGEEMSQVLAETGSYDASNRILDLNADVNFSTDNGYSFSSEHARIFLREERVVGEMPVEGSGPMGTIRADRYEIHNGGDRVIFDGNVQARFLQDRTAETAGETE